MFYPGQQVECVRADWSAPHVAASNPRPGPPKNRGVYTVNDTYRVTVEGVEYIGLILESITCACNALVGEIGWDAKNFRPVQDEKLSVFRALLAPKPKQLEQV